MCIVTDGPFFESMQGQNLLLILDHMRFVHNSEELLQMAFLGIDVGSEFIVDT